MSANQIDRIAKVQRKTKETDISVEVNLDGSGKFNLKTGIPFLEHMLTQIAVHGQIDININAVGDLHIDSHHTIEDIGITFGQAVNKALGDKKGIVRFGNVYVPLDESLSRVVVDISGRPTLVFNVDFAQNIVGSFELALVREFFQAYVNHSLQTLHIDNLRGVNAHHQCESIFKAFARAFRCAITIDKRLTDVVPSSKGNL